MKKLIVRQYIADAFTDTVFKGNPAAICLLQNWISDEMMQNIAKENRLSETAFTVKKDQDYELRWFTPGGEIDLCGHATLGTAYILFNFIEKDREDIIFHTMSGNLTIHRNGDIYEMDMPAYELKEIPVTDEMEKAVGIRPKEAWMGRDLVCVLDNEEDVVHAKIDQEAVLKLDGLLLHITAKGKSYDCVTRSFAPKLLVDEDPVCGSGHCHVIPLWAEKLGKGKLTAWQASERSGVLYCQMKGSGLFLAVKRQFIQKDISTSLKNKDSLLYGNKP